MKTFKMNDESMQYIATKTGGELVYDAQSNEFWVSIHTENGDYYAIFSNGAVHTIESMKQFGDYNSLMDFIKTIKADEILKAILG